MNGWMLIAALGWALAIVAVFVGVDQQRIIRNTREREDWYRGQALTSIEILSKIKVCPPGELIK